MCCAELQRPQRRLHHRRMLRGSSIRERFDKTFEYHSRELPGDSAAVGSCC